MRRANADRTDFDIGRGFQFSAGIGSDPAIRPPLEAKFFQMRHIVEPARDHLVAFDNNPADRAVRRTVEGKGAHARCDRHRRPDHATMDHDGNRLVRVPRRDAVQTPLSALVELRRGLGIGDLPPLVAFLGPQEPVKLKR